MMRKHLWLMMLLLGAQPLAAREELQTPSLANQCGRTHRATLPAIPGTHKIAPFPVIAQRLGVQGDTWMRVTAGKDGAVSDVTVIISSGNRRLDEISVKTVKENWRFEPPPPECRESGVVMPVAMVFSLYEGSDPPDRYRSSIFLDSPAYPPGARNQKVGGMGIASLLVWPMGDVSDLKIAHSAGNAELDEKILEIGRDLKFPARPEAGEERLRIQFIPHDNPEEIPGLMGPAETPP